MTAGAVTFLKWSLTFIEKSIDESTDATVTAEKKAELKRELQRLRNNLRDKNDAAEAQPILLEINRAISDRRLTAEEVDDLIDSLKKANDRLEGKAPTTDAATRRRGDAARDVRRVALSPLRRVAFS